MDYSPLKASIVRNKENSFLLPSAAVLVFSRPLLVSTALPRLHNRTPNPPSPRRCLRIERRRMANERFVYIILAIFIPPLPVFLKYGCKEKFWLCLLLTLFFFLPGLIYAIYVLTK